MTHTARSGFVVVLAVTAALSLTWPGEAAQRAPGILSGPQSPSGQLQPGSTTLMVVDDANVEQSRERFYAVMDRYPPALGRMLKLEPSLMTNDTYLAPYPALVAFLGQHPEVVRNPSYFLERVDLGGHYGNAPDPETMRRRESNDMLGRFAGLLVFLVVAGVITWLIRTVMDYRRWNRLSKTQFDVHSKLLDRFTSNEELLAYIQTSPGRRFLESAPIPLHDDSRPLGAPLSRILWSVQAGIVSSITGIGLLFLSRRLTDQPSQFFFVVGTVTLALGCGFIVSAAVAYALSQRLGLLNPPASDHD